jgi:hypothetical protein
MGGEMNSSGNIRRCAVLSRKSVCGFSTSYPAIRRWPVPIDAAAQLLDWLADVGAAADERVQRETMHVGTRR